MELTHYFRVLIKRWWLITTLIIVTVVCTAIFTWRQAPIYSATTSFTVSPSTTIFSDPRGFLSGLDVLGARGSVANTYADIATSRRIRKDTIQALGLNTDQVEAIDVTSKIMAGTNVIHITAEGPDPVLITNFANKLGENTVKYVEELYGVYELKILDLAETPRFPIRPNWKLNLALAAVLSLATGVGLVFLIDYLDDTLRTPDEITEIFQTPLIGFIPVMPKDAAQGLFVYDQPLSAAAEAFRSLRMNLEFVSVDQPLRTILVTSIGPGDGKSSIATNLALTFAQSGKKVVLIDTDLRHPTVHRFFSIPNARGVSEIIRGNVNLKEAVHRSTEGGVVVIPAGMLPPNPAELLSSKKMEQFIATLKDSADIVILDSAPLMLADTWVLSAKLDGVLLVAETGRIKKKTAKAIMDQIQLGRVRIVGLALNRVINGSNAGYYSGYLTGASEYYSRGCAEKEKNFPGILQKSWLRLFAHPKNTNGNGRIQKDAQPDGIMMPILAHFSAEYPQDVLDLLLEISRELSVPGSFQELLQRLLRLVLKEVGGTSGSIVVLDETGQIMGGALAYEGAIYSPPIQQLADTIELGLAGWIIQNRETAIIASTRDDSRWLSRPWDQSKKTSRSIISVSLAHDGRAFGAITLAQSRPGMFSQKNLMLLKTIGACISMNSAIMAPSRKLTI